MLEQNQIDLWVPSVVDSGNFLSSKLVVVVTEVWKPRSRSTLGSQTVEQIELIVSLFRITIILFHIHRMFKVITYSRSNLMRFHESMLKGQADVDRLFGPISLVTTLTQQQLFCLNLNFACSVSENFPFLCGQFRTAFPKNAFYTAAQNVLHPPILFAQWLRYKSVYSLSLQYLRQQIVATQQVETCSYSHVVDSDEWKLSRSITLTNALFEVDYSFVLMPSLTLCIFFKWIDHRPMVYVRMSIFKATHQPSICPVHNSITFRFLALP